MKLIEIIPIVRKEPWTAHGSPVYRMLYSGNHRKQGFTVSNITTIYKHLRKSFGDKKDKFTVATSIWLIYKRKHWSMSDWFPMTDEKPKIADFYDEVVCKHVAFYIMMAKTPVKKTRAGGNDHKNNDCLFECISKAYSYDYELFPKKMRYPEKFKAVLGLEREELISMDLIPIVENKFKTKINVIGDFIYTSDKKYPKVINLSLKNSHYSLIDNTNKQLLKGQSYKVKTLLIFDEETNYGYDGVSVKKYTIDEIKTIKATPKTSIYAVIYKDDDKEIKTQFNEMMELRDQILDISKNKIDISKSLFNVKLTVFNILMKKIKKFEKPEPLDVIEDEWIYNATRGALIFGTETPTTIEEAVVYDINSFYSSVMSCRDFMMPIKQGAFQTLDELPEIIPYGIYRINVMRSGVELIDRLFRFNSKHFYTHFDLTCAKKLGLVMNLFIDGHVNALTYDVKTRKNGKTYFNETIEYLYSMKSEHKFFKSLLSCLWGALSEKMKVYKNTKDEAPINITDHDRILNILPTDGDHSIITLEAESFHYKNHFGRLEPFLLSKCRLIMSQYILPINSHVFRVHTDSILVDERMDEYFKVDNKIGNWKEEHSGECQISKSVVKWL